MMEVGGLCSVIIMTGCMEYGERYLGVICGRCVSGYNLVIHHVKWLPGTAVVLYFTTLGIYQSVTTKYNILSLFSIKYRNL